jgi:peptide/nickel transport system substrate-binding protein
LIDSDTFYGPGSKPDSSAYFQGDLQEYDISTSSPDPAPYMRFWTCDQIPEKKNNWSGLNIGRWCNPDYDTLLKQADTVLDPEKRQEIFIQLNDQQVEDVAMINTVHLAQVSGVNNTLTGLDPTPWDGDLWNLKDWRRILP